LSSVLKPDGGHYPILLPLGPAADMPEETLALPNGFFAMKRGRNNRRFQRRYCVLNRADCSIEYYKSKDDATSDWFQQVATNQSQVSKRRGVIHVARITTKHSNPIADEDVYCSLEIEDAISGRTFLLKGLQKSEMDDVLEMFENKTGIIAQHKKQATQSSFKPPRTHMEGLVMQFGYLAGDVCRSVTHRKKCVRE